MVDGGEDGVQADVGRGQRLDDGLKLRTGLLVAQDGQTHGKETLWILPTHQNLSQDLSQLKCFVPSRRRSHVSRGR